MEQARPNLDAVRESDKDEDIDACWAALTHIFTDHIEDGVAVLQSNIDEARPCLGVFVAVSASRSDLIVPAGVDGLSVQLGRCGRLAGHGAIKRSRDVSRNRIR